MLFMLLVLLLRDYLIVSFWKTFYFPYETVLVCGVNYVIVVFYVICVDCVWLCLLDNEIILGDVIDVLCLADDRNVIFVIDSLLGFVDTVVAGTIIVLELLLILLLFALLWVFALFKLILSLLPTIVLPIGLKVSLAKDYLH